MTRSKKLIFVTEARFFRDKYNNFYCEKSFDINIWERYLTYFDEINVLARVQNISTSQTMQLVKISNVNINFLPLPYFIGLKQLLLQRKKLIEEIENNLKDAADYKVILRVPGSIGYYSAKYLKKKSLKYSVEIVGDPDEVFAKNNFRHPLRPLLRIIAVNQLKYVLEGCTAALFVTKTTLQDKYPLKHSQLSFGISDVNIPDDLIVTNPKEHTTKKIYKIISVGSLAQMYKSPDIVLKAVKSINDSQSDFKVELVWLGDGLYKNSMVNLAKELKIDSYVDFRGNVSRESVLDSMRGSDLFVLASRTEGLPRVVIEAMAMGLPIIATNVGGIPELINDKALVAKNNEEALAKKIIDILTNTDFYNEESKVNLENSKNYKMSHLNKLRNGYFNSL